MSRVRNTFSGSGSYRSQEIGYNASNEQFYCNELALTHETLSGLHKLIDVALKKENKIDFPALYLHRDGWGDDAEWICEQVTVTTLVASRSSYGETWIKRADGRSEKVSVNDLYPHSENEAIKVWMKMWAEVNAKRKDADRYHERLKRFDMDKLKAAAKSEGKP